MPQCLAVHQIGKVSGRTLVKQTRGKLLYIIRGPGFQRNSRQDQVFHFGFLPKLFLVSSLLMPGFKGDDKSQIMNLRGRCQRS